MPAHIVAMTIARIVAVGRRTAPVTPVLLATPIRAAEAQDPPSPADWPVVARTTSPAAAAIASQADSAATQRSSAGHTARSHSTVATAHAHAIPIRRKKSAHQGDQNDVSHYQYPSIVGRKWTIAAQTVRARASQSRFSGPAFEDTYRPTRPQNRENRQNPRRLRSHRH